MNLFKKTYASLGAGSAELHGSGTRVGASGDVRVNDLLGYVVFHEMIKPLQSNSTVINELSNSTRQVLSASVLWLKSVGVE